ncbi:MAG: bifunctional methylenetetrahydrofolate dehydrogenase/methenyltetrahydrofolate cyclohydrolase FolD [Candidatus Competibacteraceae bacterium]|jgi:methylenetetrahydrofolate dehydrogenase (NADP+)/methenyltetrahydrofolate cyclohydrolase|nr:bifunctional methylenetetrahydrofolate dehydrogenase/methenyltetrahydrofolate cyclohydrolase FolD [Candidatus Competibacteraceae bacterium]
MAEIIDGKGFAAQLRSIIAQQAVQLCNTQGITPGLAVVLVGEDPASQVYVRNKTRQAEQAGIASFEHRLPAHTSQAHLLTLLTRLNQNPAVHGILVQLPLPDHIDPQAVIEAIDPRKDVDGFHPLNLGRLLSGGIGFIPCTPLGCLLLLKSIHADLAGSHALVLGRSNIVGKPMAALLLRENCTVTVAHSRTRDLIDHCRQADILVAAVGRQQLVQGDWLKPGATVLDVGINRLEGESTGLVGDVDFASAVHHAGAITPVPGGVGPMTIACLLLNTVVAACRQHGASLPEPLYGLVH